MKIVFIYTYKHSTCIEHSSLYRRDFDFNFDKETIYKKLGYKKYYDAFNHRISGTDREASN